MGRNGKIARLSRGTREQLNRRLMDGEPAVTLLPWLNGLPETQALVASEFGGKPVNAVNLTKWRQGGLLEESATLLLLEAQVSSLDPNLATEGPESATSLSSTQAANSTGEPAAKPDSRISLDEVSALLTMRYTALLHLLDQKNHGAFRARLRPLRQLTREVARLRRGEALGLATELRRSKMVAGCKLQVAGGGSPSASGNHAPGLVELETRQEVPGGADVSAGKLT